MNLNAVPQYKPTDALAHLCISCCVYTRLSIVEHVAIMSVYSDVMRRVRSRLIVFLKRNIHKYLTSVEAASCSQNYFKCDVDLSYL